MIFNNKVDCIDSMTNGLTGTANWRTSKASTFQSDSRNLMASETLQYLAKQAVTLSDEHWIELKKHYSWCSEHWLNSLSQAAREVGFRNRARDFPSFVRSLIGILSTPGVV